MPISLTRNNLLSRATRSAIAGGSLSRRLNINPSLASNIDDGSGAGNLLQQAAKSIKSWARRFGGFLSAALRGISITVSSIFGIFVNATQQLSQFNWNASDRQLKATIQQRNIQLASVWGGALGSGVGWIAGIGVGYGLTILCPVIGSASLARLAAGETTLEALEELRGTTANALRATSGILGTNLLVGGYMKFRKALGIHPADNAPSWTIAGKIEEKVESIRDPLIQAFVEEFVDEFFDSFVESGYVFAYELDAQLAAARAAKQPQVERQIELTPDKEAPAEKLILVGSESDLKTQIRETIVSHRLIANRDVGQIVGQPAEDWYRAQPKRRQLVIEMIAREKPPWQLKDGKWPRRATYTIPDPKINLKWEEIKRAAKPYNWGRFRVTANLASGRQMAVYGASPREAEEKLQDLLALTDAEILTMSTSEERIRNINIKKESTRVYPAHGNLLVRTPSLDSKGRTDLRGRNWKENHVRFALWTKDEPSNFKDIIW